MKDSDFDRHFAQMNKQSNRIFNTIMVAWVFAGLIALGTAGALIYALYAGAQWLMANA